MVLRFCGSLYIITIAIVLRVKIVNVVDEMIIKYIISTFLGIIKIIAYDK